MGYKDTPIGRIPEDWDVKPLRDIAEYINGYPFSPKDWKGRGLPIIRIQNLNDPTAKFNYFDENIDEKYIVNNGDLLFSWSGSIGVYLWKRGKAVLNQHIFKVIPKSNLDKLYLYYAMLLAIEQLKNKVHGSTMKHFKKSELRRTFVPLPPLEEQRKIAEVLSTVDKAIEKVDEAIAKTERLKKGLIQELLTKGIGHKEFKYSKELGCEIPKEWEVVRLGEVGSVKTGPFGSQLKKEELTSKGFKIYEQENVIYKDFNRGSSFISSRKFETLRNFEVLPDDVLLSRVGSIGYAVVVPENILPGIIGSRLLRIRLDKTIAYSYYLAIVLMSALVQRQIAQSAHGATRKGLNTKIVKNLKIPLPPLEEQRKIAKILSTVDKKLELEKKRKEKLERIKKGLMNDLLTGRRRVKVYKNGELIR